MITGNGHSPKVFWFHSIAAFIKGLRVTFIHLFRPPTTLKYPEERAPLPERFRGLLHNDVETCIACTLCATACPVDCFEIEFEKAPVGSPKKRILTKFNIDMVKCMFCGLCTEVCPPESLTMSGGYEGSVDRRSDLVFRFIKPDSRQEILARADAEAKTALAAKAAAAPKSPPPATGPAPQAGA